MNDFHQEFQEAVTEFLSEFGEEVSLNGNTVIAIYDEYEIETDAGIIRQPQLSVSASLLNTISKGALVVVRNRNYSVRRIRDIDQTMPVLELERAQG